jgi:hypothetical protein
MAEAVHDGPRGRGRMVGGIQDAPAGRENDLGAIELARFAVAEHNTKAVSQPDPRTYHLCSLCVSDALYLTIGGDV